MGFPEFVIVIASIMALNPIAMDMMLPALPDIAATFHITAANRPQMVLSIFLLGFGVGQFVMGPLLPLKPCCWRGRCRASARLPPA